ncbi:MAG: hypothetical protein WC604_04320 [Candidatus Gracilibacteria bacterium]
MIGLILPIGQKKRAAQAAAKAEQKAVSKAELEATLKPEPELEERPDTDGNRDKHFKGQQTHEEVICFCRKHWIAALPHIGLWALLTLIVSVFILSFGKFAGLVRGNVGIGILYAGVLVLMTVYLHKIFSRLFAHFLNIVIFTDSRVIVHNKTLFLQDSHEVLDIAKIQDVKKSQDGILKNLLRYGELVITLASNNASRLLPYVPNVNFHFRCLSRIKRDTDLRGQIESLREEEFRDHRSFSREKSEEMIRLERQQVEDAYKKIIGEVVKSKTEVVKVKVLPPTYRVPSYNELILPQADVEKTL